jgi:outer membrane murein-binding lipoprotein Lpp
MEEFNIAQWAQLIITLLTIIVGGVWVVGSIKTTTAVLSAKIESLGKAIDALQIVCRTMATDHHALSDRVSRLEARIGSIAEAKR